MTTSMYIALASLCLSAALTLAWPDSRPAAALAFIAGTTAIAGLGFNIVIWILSGYGLPLQLKRNNATDERKAIMVFNKINAPSQNRRDTLVITVVAIVVIAASTALFHYLF